MQPPWSPTIDHHADVIHERGTTHAAADYYSASRHEYGCDHHAADVIHEQCATHAAADYYASMHSARGPVPGLVRHWDELF